jgi:hypothetical protein
MRESVIEKALGIRVKELGGLCEKFVSPGRVGVPDRIITLPGGIIIFVELKAPGKSLRVPQLRDHARRAALGCVVMTIDNLDAAKGFTYVTT